MSSALLIPRMPFALRMGRPFLPSLLTLPGSSLNVSSCETLASSTCLLYYVMAFIIRQSWVQIPSVFTDSVTDCHCFYEFLFPGVAQGVFISTA